MVNIVHSIELHDSVLDKILTFNGCVTISLNHAYIYKDGKGWAQKALIKINSAALSSRLHSLPKRISDGLIKTTVEVHDNLLPLPFKLVGSLELSLVLEDSQLLTVSGHGLEIELLGPAEFIENTF